MASCTTNGSCRDGHGIREDARQSKDEDLEDGVSAEELIVDSNEGLTYK